MARSSSLISNLCLVLIFGFLAVHADQNDALGKAGEESGAQKAAQADFQLNHQDASSEEEGEIGHEALMAEHAYFTSLDFNHGELFSTCGSFAMR
jgi:hypothetical protein